MSDPDASLRPTNLTRDLSSIADLVELCFAKTLDDDGRNFVRNMRQSAKNPRLIGGTSRLMPTFTGYVWKEEGRLVGNLSMIPVLAMGRKGYLIANVAVHPDFRGRGIARKLTRAALDQLRKRGVKSAWLQVREENQTAIHLYQAFGFSEQVRRTVWHSRPVMVEAGLPEEYKITDRRRADWKKQKIALEQLYPPKVIWNLALDFSMFAPGIVGGVWRGLNEHQTRQWSLRRGGTWLGSVCFQSSYLQADWLWLAAPPENREIAIQMLLPHARRERGTRRTLALNYPAGEHQDDFESIGFQAHQTLIWMRAEIE